MYCYITNPYFIPVKAISHALIDAAKRGVDVKVIAAGHCDHFTVHLASQRVYIKLLQGGVKVYEYQGHTLHAKTIIVDGVVAGVGSYNLDLWSGWTSLEALVNVYDPITVSEVLRHFLVDFATSRQVTYEELYQRFVVKRVSYWMAYNIYKLLQINRKKAQKLAQI